MIPRPLLCACTYTCWTSLFIATPSGVRGSSIEFMPSSVVTTIARPDRSRSLRNVIVRLLQTPIVPSSSPDGSTSSDPAGPRRPWQAARCRPAKRPATSGGSGPAAWLSERSSRSAAGYAHAAARAARCRGFCCICMGIWSRLVLTCYDPRADGAVAWARSPAPTGTKPMLNAGQVAQQW